MSSHYPDYVSPRADEEIRKHFPIQLSPEEMKPGNERWGA
jgi:hypothetical protein